MKDSYYEHIIHGGDYNPDQWINTKEIWDEDMRLMDLAHINSATVGIFSWSLLEPEEGVYSFSWLDEIMDKLDRHGKKVILSTPSGARPPWMAEKYPEVLRVSENGIRNEYGVRHNHCLASPVYRKKVSEINRALAERYKDHPALFMWHISNEYSGECHCELCQQAFREWLKKEYDNDIEKLNFKWWGGFWSHRYSSFSQISSPKDRGENHVPALKLAWKRFVTDSHISFYENEIAPIRELTPEIPVTTNLMRFYNGIDYQKLSEHLDIVSWDNYPEWTHPDFLGIACETAFAHDIFRSMKNGKPFYMMESTPSLINWRPVNKLPASGITELAAIQAVAHGADSVQYFQWRKGRGGHEKFHGAVVDHCGKEDTRVFRDTEKLGRVLSQLDRAVGSRTKARAAVICDWENSWAVEGYCGYRRDGRDYFKVCERWYRAFWERGIPADVVPMDRDISGYDIVVAPYLYMLKDGTVQRLSSFVQNGGTLIATCLTGIADRDDLCYLGGFPAEELKDVFGVWCEETDSLYDDELSRIAYGEKEYKGTELCDILHLIGGETLGSFLSGFYKGSPAVTKNSYGKGEAYYVAFCPGDDFISDFISPLADKKGLLPDINASLPKGVIARKRGELIYLMNFTSQSKTVDFGETYTDHLTKSVLTSAVLPEYGYLILE
ncbi:MAG: beta-galactosidase [Oscillospiraceae bacterium]|nr:beta-galactosidase [Oscillospiraceae bacterium]